ncbi:MAG: hypothetical protein ACOYO9_09965 [Candidatus Nanopelagicales bacterium]
MADGRVLLVSRAALLVHSQGAIRHSTAARFVGLPTQRLEQEVDAEGIPIIDITRPGHRRKTDWLQAHGGELAHGDVSISGMIRRTSLLRTAIDAQVSCHGSGSGRHGCRCQSAGSWFGVRVAGSTGSTSFGT